MSPNCGYGRKRSATAIVFGYTLLRPKNGFGTVALNAFMVG